MAKINLLPWREELRKQKQQEFLLALVGSAITTLGIMLAVHFFYEIRIVQQNVRNKFLESEIAILDQKIKEIDSLEEKKRVFVAKMGIIQELEASRPEIVHVFEEVATTTPDGIYLSKVTLEGRTLTFDGAAQSNARVSAYMRNLESSPWLADPVLAIIETKGTDNQGRVSRFTLNVQQKKR
ncbi:MAG: PilN domain-containing protein [Methylococcales bacterium]